MKILRSIRLIINYKTFIITVLAVASTWLCRKYEIKADFPLTIVGIAIVFPVVFSIDSAFKRRERLLSLIGDMKAHMYSLHLAGRDWIEKNDGTFSAELRRNTIEVYQKLHDFCTAHGSDVQKEYEKLTLSVSQLSAFSQGFRALGLQVGEVSRVSQYISKIMVDIENIKAIKTYPTPVTLRAYSKVFIYTFPVIYGPYFMHIGHAFSNGIEFMMPVIFSFILVSLDNIQEHLENPFDQVGEDDVKFDVKEFSERLV